MSNTHLTPLEPGRRIQLPTEWADALGLHGQVALERTSEGILVRPSPPLSWDDIFAKKLIIRSAPPDPKQDDVEVSGDDFLF